MPLRVQNLVLVVLGLCTLGLIGFAMRGSPALPALEPPQSHSSVAGPSTSSADTGTTTTTAQDPSTAAVDPTSHETGTAETGSAETVTPTTVTPTDGGDAALATAREAVAGPDPVTVLVLGDSTSNTRDEWVHRWARNLAQSRPVTISHWDELGQQGYAQPDVLSEDGEGGPVTIWSGSQAGFGPWYAEARLDDLVPEPPDMVMYNYGHLVAADEIAPSLDALHTALEGEVGEVPSVVVLQNPRLGTDDADVRDAAAGWAADNDLAAIDVAAAFQAAGDLEALMADETQPNSAGSQLWADTVGEALTP